MWDIGLIVVALLFITTLIVLGWGIVGYLRQRPTRSRTQRTVTEDTLDDAAEALASDNLAAGDHRPRRRRLWKPHWTTLGGILRENVTEQDD